MWYTEFVRPCHGGAKEDCPDGFEGTLPVLNMGKMNKEETAQRKMNRRDR